MDRYTFPVNQLLSRGEPPEDEWGNTWADYRSLGIGPEHVPELTGMMLDSELHTADDERFWAPVHAWRALGQMGVASAAPAYLDMLSTLDNEGVFSDWSWEDANPFFSKVGPPAITPLADALANSRYSFGTRVGVPGNLAAIAQAYPETRTQIVAILAGHLERAAVNDPGINAWAVCALIELKANEAAGVMEKAFADGRIDPRICGNWDTVAYDMGLRDTPPPSRRVDHGWFVPHEPGSVPYDRSDAKRKSKNRTRSKTARASRKRNRKRR